MAHMHVTGIESEIPRPPIEVSTEPIAEISATLLRAQAFLSGCGIALLVREGTWLVCRASNGAASPEIGTRMPVEQTFLGLCVTMKKPQSCEDADADTRVESASYSRQRPKSILAVPVRAGQEVIAVLASFSAAPNAFSHTQIAILRTVADSLSRPVQQLPLSPPLPEPPAPRPEARPEPLREKAAKPEPMPAPPAAPPIPAPKPEQELVTLADDIAAPRRLPEPRLLAPRLSPPQVRVVTFPVPQSFEFARPRPRRVRPAIFRIAGITMACLLCALATAGWYSSRVPAAPRYPSAPAAPAVMPPPSHVEPVAASAPEATSAPKESAPADSKLHAAAPAPAEPQPAKTPNPEPPVAEIVAPRLPQAAPAAVVEAPALALNASAGLPALDALPAAAPKIHHSVAAPARLEYRVPPQYPMVALKRHVAGQVTLSLVVRKDGSVTDVKLLSGNPFFRDSAIDAVKKWRYSPATLDGDPVEATAQVVLKFDLPTERR
jgi:protein TonB